MASPAINRPKRTHIPSRLMRESLLDKKVMASTTTETEISILPDVNIIVLLIKDSSLLSIIAVNEFTQAARDVNSVTFSTLECYLPLAAGYLVLTLPLSLWLRGWEKKLRFET